MPIVTPVPERGIDTGPCGSLLVTTNEVFRAPTALGANIIGIVQPLFPAGIVKGGAVQYAAPCGAPIV